MERRVDGSTRLRQHAYLAHFRKNGKKPGILGRFATSRGRFPAGNPPFYAVFDELLQNGKKGSIPGGLGHENAVFRPEIRHYMLFLMIIAGVLFTQF